MSNNRVFYYDFLRTIAILSVILAHTAYFYDLPGNTGIHLIISDTLLILSRLGVPLFFMLSGALLLNKQYELSYFLKRRFTRILYPFIFWMIIILMGIYFINGTTHLLDMLLGRNGQFSWFVWVLMGMYLFIPIFNTFLNRYGIDGAKYYLILWFITIILNEVKLYPVGSFDLSLFAGWFGILVLGYYLDNYDFKISDSKMCIIGFLIFIISLIVNVYLNYIGFESFGYQSLLTLTPTLGIFLFIKYLNKINSIKYTALGKAITSISICSYGMYFTHIIVVRPFLLLLNHAQPLYITGLIYIAVCFISWIIIYILSKIPYLKKISGT